MQPTLIAGRLGRRGSRGPHRLLPATLGAIAALASGGCSVLPDGAPQVPGEAQAARTLRPVTHGVAVGSVDDRSAVVWARCDRSATLAVSIADAAGSTSRTRRLPVRAARDFTGRVPLAGLRPATRYRFRAWCELPAGSDDGIARAHTIEAVATAGTFETAPEPQTVAPVRFAFGGDLGGQNVCRDRELGYPIFDTIIDEHPAFFVGLGDMIYADNHCSGPPPRR